jgi:predicted nucleic acid-binding protein
LEAARQISIFCDADVLIAGAASTTGASHILLQLGELTLVKCVTSQYAINEVERNLSAKLPAAITPFRLIVKAAVTIVSPASSSLVHSMAGEAHPKDVPILAAAIASKADFLATFNVRHFYPRKIPPLVRRPGELVAHIRRSLIHLLN